MGCWVRVDCFPSSYEILHLLAVLQKTRLLDLCRTIGILPLNCDHHCPLCLQSMLACVHHQHRQSVRQSSTCHLATCFLRRAGRGALLSRAPGTLGRDAVVRRVSSARTARLPSQSVHDQCGRALDPDLPCIVTHLHPVGPIQVPTRLFQQFAAHFRPRCPRIQPERALTSDSKPRVATTPLPCCRPCIVI